ncbi:MAG: DinB family protein [Thermomicrobiales bacterium]
MGHALDDLAKHNIWATAQLLSYCKKLDEATLNSTVPGSYGTILETLRHIIDSECSYLFRLTGAWAELPWNWDDPYDLDILAERAELLGRTMLTFLGNDVDTEKLGEARGDDGTIFAVPASIFITQIFHHANEHRAQIGTIIGSLGFDAPWVSAWEYSFETGRSTITVQGKGG